jgi:hypothetical protein
MRERISRSGYAQHKGLAARLFCGLQTGKNAAKCSMWNILKGTHSGSSGKNMKKHKKVGE